MADFVKPGKRFGRTVAQFDPQVCRAGVVQGSIRESDTWSKRQRINRKVR